MFTNQTYCRESLYVVGLGKAKNITEAIITAMPLILQPTKIFFCKKFVFGLAGSVNELVTKVHLLKF